MYFLVFYLGLAIGTVLGIAVTSMCAAAKKADESINNPESRGGLDEAEI